MAKQDLVYTRKWGSVPPLGFSGGSVVKNPPASAEDSGSIPGSGKLPGRGNGYPFQHTYLPGKSHRQGSLEGSTPWGRKKVRHDLTPKQQGLFY